MKKLGNVDFEPMQLAYIGNTEKAAKFCCAYNRFIMAAWEMINIYDQAYFHVNINLRIIQPQAIVQETLVN